MRKNVAGQLIAAEMVSVDDGSAFTGTVTVYITGDGGSQAIGAVGSGVCTHEGNGLHTYAPSQAETNYTHIAFTFVGSGAIPVTIQVYTNVDQQLVDIQSRIPATLDGGNMRSSVQSMAANTLTASALAADAVSEIQSGLALQSTLNTLGSTVVAIGLAVDGKPTLTQIEGTTVLAKQNTLTTGITDILTAVGVGDVEIDNETIAQLVFQSIVGSGLAKYSIPQVTGTVEAVKYADFELSISASTASDSVLYLSIGCENHTTPNLQANSTDGLTILNQLEDFGPADVTVQRTSPTVVDVWISARVLSKLSAADYLIALTEITTDNKTKLRFEKHFTIRSGAGRIIG